MKLECIAKNGVKAALVFSDSPVIRDVQSALNLIMTVKYETGADRVAIEKTAVAEEFFVLSNKMAGEILQRFVNYRIKAAIWGDYSQYDSKALKDFIYESNKGRDIFFTSTRQEALEKLIRS